MIYEEILPHYLALGVDYEFFMQSNPFEMRSYDKAFKLKQQLEDERDWRMGQYNMSAFQTILSRAFSKNSDVTYIKKPLLQDAIDEKTDDIEANEKLAVIEMELFIAELKKRGDLPTTLITDIRRKSDE